MGVSVPLVLLAAGACGPSTTEGTQPPPPPPPQQATCDDSATSQFVANKLTLPSLTESYATDVDGDGSKDNGFQMLFTGLEAAGFGTQTMVNNMVQYGRGMTLVQVRGSGRTEGCATSVSMQPGSQPGTPPRFDGKDRFTPRSGSTPVSSRTRTRQPRRRSATATRRGAARRIPRRVKSRLTSCGRTRC